MRLRVWTLLVGAGLAVGAGAVAGACSYPSVPPPPAGAGSGGSCTTSPGTYPPPNCDDKSETCAPPTPACPTSPCDSTSACLAMAQNVAGQPADLRLRKMNITAPPALAATFLQTGIIDQGVNLKNACGEGGDGSFSWLVHFDTRGKQVTTGGAPPTDDPFNVGYCFAKEQINGLNVQPVTVGVTQAPDGSYTSDLIPKLYVPIYVHGSASNVVVLPLTNTTVKRVTLSPDSNCIGSYNPSAVDTPPDVGAACADQDPSDCQRWHTAGALGGFITLIEADGVFIQDLQKSLCVLLTRGTAVDASGQHCAKDPSGNITAMGDYCSKTNAPGGCSDSFWLAATFAASAAKINDGTKDPACNGSGVVAADGGGADASAEGGGLPEAAGPDSTAPAVDAGPG